jgi:hypothetical protein
MKLLISDTCNAIVKRKSDGHVFITAETQMTSLSGSLGVNEKIFGSLGNKALAVMKGQKEVTSTFRNAFYDQEILSMTQGVAVDKDGSATVYETEEDLTVVDQTGVLSVDITGTPIGTTVYVRNAKGETESATIATKKVTVPTGHAVAGEKVSVTYTKSVTGEIVTLDSEKFGEAYSIEYHTIGYDPPISGWLSDRYGSRELSSLGLFISALGLLGMVRISANTSVLELSIWMFITGLGSGMFFSPNTSAIMGAVPVERRGIAAGVRTMMNNAGSVISIAIAMVIISSSIDPKALQGLFTGTQVGSEGIAIGHFISGLRTAFAISFVISLLAAFISYLRGPQPKWEGKH